MDDGHFAHAAARGVVLGFAGDFRAGDFHQHAVLIVAVDKGVEAFEHAGEFVHVSASQMVDGLRVRPNSTAFSAKLTKNVPVLCWWNCRFSSGGT